MGDMASSDVPANSPAAPAARCSVGFAQDSLESGVVEAVRQALAGLGTTRPDLAVVTVAAPGDATTGGRILGHADGVIAGQRAVEMEPAVSVWLAAWPGAAPRPFRVATRPAGDSVGLTGLPEIDEDDKLAVCLVDPWTTPIDEVLAGFSRIDGDLPLVGGFASAGQRGENRLLLGSAVLDSGVVGVVLDAQAPVRAVVSHGCRPIGAPMTVTSSRGAFLIEMASHPALERVRSIVEQLPPEEQALAVRGLQMGIARSADVEGGAEDYLMRAIIGADPSVPSPSVMTCQSARWCGYICAMPTLRTPICIVPWKRSLKTGRVQEPWSSPAMVEVGPCSPRPPMTVR
jgi:small ligand-binding sensory domain FIST